jgi:hypothetical protein
MLSPGGRVRLCVNGYLATCGIASAGKLLEFFVKCQIVGSIATLVEDSTTARLGEHRWQRSYIISTACDQVEQISEVPICSMFRFSKSLNLCLLLPAGTSYTSAWRRIHVAAQKKTTQTKATLHHKQLIQYFLPVAIYPGQGKTYTFF